MLLRVGELAKQTGLTVRTLHHYDSIGLLKPSHRSGSDYRLYSQQDVARLHGIQTLRHMGLPLGEIGNLLDRQSGSPLRIIERQIESLDQEIERSTELRARLALMHERLQSGSQLDMSDWLTTLSLMTTYSRHFNTAELRRFFKALKPLETQWQSLIADVREAMNCGCKYDSPELQPLVTRWIALAQKSTDGDFELMERWRKMYLQEPGIHGRDQSPEGDMIRFIHTAIDLRLALLSKYLQPDELRDLRWIEPYEWVSLDEQIAGLMRNQVTPQCPDASAAMARWSALMDRVCNQNRIVRDKLLTAYACEPLLAAGLILSPSAQAYIAQSFQK